MTFEDLRRLSRGVHQIGGKEFQEILAETIGASREYARSCFSRFKNDPIGYMSSRVPEIQGQRLLELAWQKGEKS